LREQMTLMHQSAFFGHTRTKNYFRTHGVGVAMNNFLQLEIGIDLWWKQHRLR
jgi:hypothetical protein